MKRLMISDIHAYLDGALSDEGRREVEEAMKADTAAAALVKQYRQQIDELHRLYNGVLDEPIPQRMLDLIRKKSEN